MPAGAVRQHDSASACESQSNRNVFVYLPVNAPDFGVLRSLQCRRMSPPFVIQSNEERMDRQRVELFSSDQWVVNVPLTLMSSDDAPTITWNSPGSTTRLPSR